MRTPCRRAAFLALLPALGAVSAQEPPPGGGAPPDMRGLVRLEEEAVYDGYTLIAPFSLDALLLIDLEGKVVHRWDVPGTESAILLPDGGVLRWGMTAESKAQMAGEATGRRFQGPGVAGGLVEELSWEGDVRWRYVHDTDEELLHHDIALLPDGNVLFLCWQHKTREEAIAAGRDPAQVDERGMWPDAIYEVKPTRPEGGEIVWSWHAWDHLVQDFDPAKENYGSVPEHSGRIDVNAEHRGRPPLTLAEQEEREAMARQMAALGYGGEEGEPEELPPRRGTAPDWMHTNAVDHLPAHDLLIVSSPHLNEVFVLDHSTTAEEAAGTSGGRFGHGGELLWRWGNPRNYGAGDDDDQRLSYQHDATWLATGDPDELRILLFNNGRVRPGAEAPYSSADELVLPFDPKQGFARKEGAACGPAAPAWSWSQPGELYSPFISGAQRLPNGNTLLCSGVQGRLVEVTKDGRIVWDFRNPFVGETNFGIPPNALYRAVRVGKDHPGLAGRAL